MALPGGRREACDEDLLGTAIRETFEETGVRLKKSELIGTLADLRPRNRSIPKVVVRPHVFLLEERPPLSPSDEVAACYWVSFERLRESACRLHVPERKVLVDAYRIGQGPRIVWGITQRILSALFLQPQFR
jgi:8-oxo-dGTP pyrophosphatase MutT (NUDIX family)